MKRLLISLAIAGTTTLACASSLKPLETEEQKVSYSQGYLLGKRMGMDFPDLEYETFIQGLNHGFAGKEQLLTDEEVGQILLEYQRTLKQKQMEKVQELSRKNKEAGVAFLAENQNKEGVVTLASGLQYKIIKEGKGVQPGAADTVKVHYTGTLINGEVFDSSVERGQPVSFPVNGVIKGWTEALQLMPTGSKWQLFIPADLAYGPNGNRSIGPNETLLFDVELLEVTQN